MMLHCPALLRAGGRAEKGSDNNIAAGTLWKNLPNRPESPEDRLSTGTSDAIEYQGTLRRDGDGRSRQAQRRRPGVARRDRRAPGDLAVLSGAALRQAAQGR